MAHRRKVAWTGLAIAGFLGLAAAPVDADQYLRVEVSTGPADADAPPGPTILAGETVNWFYQVTAVGVAEVTDVAVTDDQGVVVSCPVSTLVPGASTVCVATATATPGPYSNVGTATGVVDADGAALAVSASDPSHFFGAAPSLDVDASFAGDDLGSEGTSSFTVIVTNAGNVDLDDVMVDTPVHPQLIPTAATVSDGIADVLDTGVVQWRIDGLTVGASATLAIVVEASPTAASGSVSMTATGSVVFVDDIDNSATVTVSGQDSVTLRPDSDGDGVEDAADLCPGSTADPAPERLKRNRFWTVDGDLSSTFGCSASQIIDDAGLGRGHVQFGISASALRSWLDTNS